MISVEEGDVSKVVIILRNTISITCIQDFFPFLFVNIDETRVITHDLGPPEIIREVLDVIRL